MNDSFNWLYDIIWGKQYSTLFLIHQLLMCIEKKYTSINDLSKIIVFTNQQK